MTLKEMALGAALLVIPVMSEAAPIQGQLDLVGAISPLSTFTAANLFVDFIGFARAQVATGDFDALVVDLDEVGSPTQFTLNDILGTAATTIYSGAGFTFYANSFLDFVNSGSPRGFTASGTLTHANFDPTPAIFTFSTQSTGNRTLKVSFSSSTETTPVPVPASLGLLGTALAGLGALRRRRAKAV